MTININSHTNMLYTAIYSGTVERYMVLDLIVVPDFYFLGFMMDT